MNELVYLQFYLSLALARPVKCVVQTLVVIVVVISLCSEHPQVENSHEALAKPVAQQYTMFDRS